MTQSPEHRPDRKIEERRQRTRHTHAYRERLGGLAVRPPPAHVRIVGEHEAERLVRGQMRNNLIHHRMASAQQMLPEKLAPPVTESWIALAAHRRAALAVQVTDDDVTARNLFGICREECSDVAPPIGKYADIDLAASIRCGRTHCTRWRNRAQAHGWFLGRDMNRRSASR